MANSTEITYEKFLELLQKASFIMADVIEVQSFDISEKPNIESVYLKGKNDELEYRIIIDKELNETIKIEGTSIFPIDDEGDTIKITFYTPMIIQN